MKKTLALLAVTAMMFTTGCGNKPAEQVQQNATEAVEQVEQTANEAKENATNAVNNAANTVQATLDEAKSLVTSIQSGTVDKKVAALDGIVPGINGEYVTEKYGEPVATENQVMQFSNGLDVKVVNNVVEEVSTMYDGLYTPADVAVGMGDSILNDAYGDASSVTPADGGGVVYKYNSKDNHRSIEFVARDGYISEIKCTLNK